MKTRPAHALRNASPRRTTRLLRGMEALEERRLLAADIMPIAVGLFSDVGQAASQDRIPGEIVVGFRAGTGGEDIRGLAQAHGLSKLQSLYMGGDPRPVQSATLPDQAVDAVLRALRNHPLVDYAEPSFIASAFVTPNDSFYKFQWHLQDSHSGSINVEAAWDVTNGEGVTVAVLDTGVAYENRSDGTGTYYVAPDLANTLFVPGYDFINNDPHANDDHSHGTHVAGTIAQSTNNSVGTAGVAYGASIMPVKVLGGDGSGSHAAVAQGIRWAADQGAHVINLSLGSSSGSTTLRDAVAYAYGKGVTIVAAAGNNGTNAVSYPAAYDNYVIAVSATRYDESLAPYSNYGSSIDLAAPGGDTSVDQNGDGYVDGVLQNTFNPRTGDTSDFAYYFFQGTSMATPHVSGVAALVASQLLVQKGAADPEAVRSILQSTARDKGPEGVDIYHGHGIVDAAAAVQATLSLVNEAPVAATVRVADLDGSVRTQSDRWRARVTTLIVDGNDQPVAGATVIAGWSDGGTSSGTTDSLGHLTLASAWQPNKKLRIRFTVTDVTASGLTYDPTANSDPDGNSNGTSIVVHKDGTTNSPKSSGDQDSVSSLSKMYASPIADPPHHIQRRHEGPTRPTISAPGLPEPTLTRQSDGLPTSHPVNGESHLRQPWDAMLLEVTAELEPLGDILE